jgi:hypothetical protein
MVSATVPVMSADAAGTGVVAAGGGLTSWLLLLLQEAAASTRMGSINPYCLIFMYRSFTVELGFTAAFFAGFV